MSPIDKARGLLRRKGESAIEKVGRRHAGDQTHQPRNQNRQRQLHPHRDYRRVNCQGDERANEIAASLSQRLAHRTTPPV